MIDMTSDPVIVQSQTHDFRTCDRRNSPEKMITDLGHTDSYKEFENDDHLFLLKQTPQVIGLHTIIRDKDCTREDFIFYRLYSYESLIIEFH